jgi:putative membrane protein
MSHRKRIRGISALHRLGPDLTAFGESWTANCRWGRKEVVMNLKNRALEAAAGLILIALPAYPQARQTVRDERIVAFIHQANLQEIDASNLAKEKNRSQSITDFADQMVKDHQSADEQVRSYARSHNIDLDTLGSQLRKDRDELIEHERQVKGVGSATGEWAWTWENAIRSKKEDDKGLDTLRKLDGAAFDREFVRVMIAGHQKVIDRLAGVRDKSIDPDLRDLIDALLPTVKHHLEMAQALQVVVSKA